MQPVWPLSRKKDQSIVVQISVLANDFDPDRTLTRPPSNSDIFIEQVGFVLYLPDPSFTGIDSFRYTVGDDEGAASTKPPYP